jgi:carboxyl-terminal processing protease
MKSLLHRRSLIILLLVVFSSVALGSWAKSKYQDRENVLHDLEIFAKVVDKVKSFYVDDVDTHQLVTTAIEDMLKQLDPHSQYLSGLDYEDLMLSTQGQFGGLGIFISFRDNYPTVISPIEDTPAFRAGLQGGDQIVEIEGESAEGWQVSKAVRMLRGDPGTVVNFKVTRPGQKDAIEYSLVREEIQVSSVTYSGMFNNDIGYVKISNFSKNTQSELEEALDQLQKDGMKSLVLDLRSNPGGLLQAATGVSELFLDKDKLVVYTKGRYAQNNHKYYASKSPKFNEYPMVVMVNGNSASASEIVAGALQDWDQAFIVGQTTFGKGTVQTVFSLSDSQAVKLTTAKYYTPTGRSIHKDDHSGLLSRMDEEAAAEGHGEDEQMSMAEEATKNAKMSDEDRPVYHTTGGRTVYGGGGITPDLTFDVRQFGDLERRLERDALFFSFAIDYDTHHDKLKENFVVDDAMVEEFKQFLKDRDFEFKDEEFSGESLEYVKRAIAREITSKEYGRQAMYRRMLKSDPDFQEVIEIMHSAPTLKDMFAYAEQQKDLKKASIE